MPPLVFDELPRPGAPAGKQILADAEGQIVVLNLWATWCIPCIRKWPDIKAIAEQHSTEVRFWMVNYDELPGAAEEFLADNDSPAFTHLVGDSQIDAALGVFGLPALFVVDPTGDLSLLYLAGSVDLGELLHDHLASLVATENTESN